jgi:HD-GYP domain-containing protein (c-di-GMP phosphodiesterase class II)
MFNALILEDDPELIDRISFLLESINGIQLKKASTRAQAIECAKQCNGRIDLLIIDFHAGPLSALNSLQKLTTHADTILCVPDKLSPPDSSGWRVNSVIERNSIASSMLSTVELWLKEKTKTIELLEGEKYCRIKTKLLIDVTPLNSDIYVKLSGAKYLKLFSEGDVFDAHDLSKYAEQKKIEYMYLKKPACLNFIQKYVLYIEDLVRSASPLTFDELTTMHTSIQESVHELTDKLGFTEEVQALARAQIQLTVKAMGKKTQLKEMLKKLENEQGNYLSDHSFLTGYIACAIASHLEWSSETTFHKLMLAAFMHDIVLTDELADCNSVEEAIAIGATEEELNAYRRHPIRVAELIKQMTDIPPDVDSIVMQHHELPGGGGFPRGISANYISPLSAIFIIAHDMAEVVFKHKGYFSITDYLDGIQVKYPQTLFKKILLAAAQLDIAVDPAQSS